MKSFLKHINFSTIDSCIINVKYMHNAYSWVAEMKINLVRFQFAKRGVYLLFAIGIYHIW